VQLFVPDPEQIANYTHSQRDFTAILRVGFGPIKLNVCFAT